MKPRRHLDGPPDGRGVRKEPVDAADPGVQRARHRRIEVHHLVGRVHAGIGPAGAHGRHRTAGQLRQGVLDRVLHGAATRLGLPAMESGTVVLKAKRQSHSRAGEKSEKGRREA